MRHPRILVSVLVSVIWLPFPGLAAPAVAADAEFQVYHLPPGLLLQGERATLALHVQTTDFNPAEGEAYVRGGPRGEFIRIRLNGNDSGLMTARIPDGVLGGRILEDYVVVRDPATGASRKVPLQGPRGPYRSWILDHPRTISLGDHRFGNLRQPGAIVARAGSGSGPDEVGFDCPPEAGCATPWSFDVGPRGRVWVADPANNRLLAWDPGRPRSPSQRIPLSFVPADVAVGPHGSVYVTGVKLPDDNHHMRLYAFAPDGRKLWMGRVLTDIFNAHIRFGPGGILHSVDFRYGWAPAIDGNHRPLSLAEQRRRVQPYQPAPAGQKLVVSTPWNRPAPRDWRVALATAAGRLEETWRITTTETFGLEGGHATPAVVAGDPVLALTALDARHHIQEYLVLRLSPTGRIRDRFSLERRFGGDLMITDLRIGPHGKVYQLQSSPDWGMRVARYSWDELGSLAAGLRT